MKPSQPPMIAAVLPEPGVETSCLAALRETLEPLRPGIAAIEQQARQWIETLRADGPPRLGLEALLLEYRLDTPEGVALMCLAEALLRIPDPAAADRLIHDVLSPLSWQRHVGHSDDIFINAASWGLALTGRMLASHEQPHGHPQPWIERIAGRLGETLLRQALQQTMRFLANQFVLGETLPAALQRAAADWRDGYTHSFDMLGEAALTRSDSRRYFAAYREAIETVGASDTPAALPRPTVSIKLSALHPRYVTAQWHLLERELVPELCTLCELAANYRVALSIDAEEADRLELSLRVIAAILERVDSSARTTIGVVVQAYNKRAPAVLAHLLQLTRRFALRMNIRLVKGAYWDSEIKRAQQRGLDTYPVFTDKNATDLSYLACAQFLLANPQAFLPQFATHNATTIAALIAMAGTREFELQRLHGMGEALYDCVRKQLPALRCRVYAPIGEHRELLPYLVRRLLENGANTSFIHQLYDHNIGVEQLAAHPLRKAESAELPLPRALFPQRVNSPGIDLHVQVVRDRFFADLAAQRQVIANASPTHGDVVVRNPANGERIGAWLRTSPPAIDDAVAGARRAQCDWARLDVDTRAHIIENVAEKLLAHRAELIASMVLETGKTIDNAHDEIREAVDYCRYYAAQARALLQAPTTLPGATGEHNQLWLRPRGVFACISPWNFPLAIFCGQILAALASGNAVIAKPAEQATLTAQRAVALMHDAGISRAVLQLVCGDGEHVGAALCGHAGIDGVVFTGGFDTAKIIQRQIAQRDGAVIPLIAETAGLNCLIADSSAQPQQLVQDVVRSAFDSAGQRCSALRVLLLPQSSAASIETLLIGALKTLQLGDPIDWSTDIGPVIDDGARAKLQRHIDKFRSGGRVVFQGNAPSTGIFFAPTVIRLQTFDELSEEAFGPVLHIAHYDEDAIDALVDTINASGFGLTCGIHSRNLQRAQSLAQRLHVGNVYINRDIIGAVVGAQPFGGCGKSGTGPKAGGPHYLQRFTTEQTITINTAALGGDPQLLSTTRHP